MASVFWAPLFTHWSNALEFVIDMADLGSHLPIADFLVKQASEKAAKLGNFEIHTERTLVSLVKACLLVFFITLSLSQSFQISLLYYN